MIHRIHIENFKGVGSPVDIKLKPVSLLFGPNSAGKSTVLHAIHYAHTVLKTNNPEVDRTRLGGALQFGGFRSVVHSHDVEKSVVLGFEFGVFEEDFEEHMAWYLRSEPGDLSVAGLETLYVELTADWSHLRSESYVSKFAVALNNEHLATITAAEDGVHSRIENISVGQVLRDYGEASVLDFSLIASEEELEGMAQGFDCMPRRGSALPYWGRTLETEETDADVSEALAVIEAMLVAGSRCLDTTLSGLRYVGPIREAPERSYVPPPSTNEARWARGLGAWDAMASDDVLRKGVSNWLEGEDHLDTGYCVARKTYRELDSDTFHLMKRDARNHRLDDRFEDHIGGLDEHGRLVLYHRDVEVELAPCDVGEGICQVIPVVAAALCETVLTEDGDEVSTALVCVEQPELHIHPRMQVVLGDLFLSQRENRQFLIETHSEHLMLRLLRRIRETYEDELPPGAPEASIEDVQVLYVASDNGETKIRPLRIAPDGEFLDVWPQGFFDERFEELYGE